MMKEREVFGRDLIIFLDIENIRNAKISKLKKIAREVFGVALPKGKEKVYFHRLMEDYLIDCELNPIVESYNDETWYENESI